VRPTTAFITGIAGFAGSYLAEELLKAGYRVTGTLLSGESTRNLRSIRKEVELFRLNVLNGARTTALLADLKPDYVFHLAALASVGHSFETVRQTLRVNLDGTINVLDAVRRNRRLKGFLFVSSSDAYGLFQPKNRTLTESQPLNPVSPYGVSKAAAEQVCSYFRRQYDLPIIIARSFNHSGPRQTDRFVIPAFARQIAAIEAGQQKPVMKVGDLSARRDFSDVRDIVRGYRLAVEKGRPGEVYQFCSAKAVSVQSVLDRLVAMSPRTIVVRVDRRRLRKSEIPVLRGSHQKATRQLGYRVRHNLKTTLADTLQYWRSQVGISNSK
jgi:GDP-4-dehydro-6-deoxy-D-mannose reductase